MFRAMISPIFRSTRLCVTACGVMHRRRCRPATSWVHYITSCNTQSSAPENGRNYRPEYVELIGIINKPLLLHVFGCLYYCISDAWSYKHQIHPRFPRLISNYSATRFKETVNVSFVNKGARMAFTIL